MTVRLAVHAMGRDNAPAAVVHGAVKTLAHDNLVFVGDEGRIQQELSSANLHL